MAFQPQTPLVGNVILPVLSYSGQFKYPLTIKEIWFWQIKSTLTLNQVKNLVLSLKKQNAIQFSSGTYFPVGKSNWPLLRQEKKQWSRLKWQKIERLVPLFSWIPSIRAVYVTGALSVNNSTRYDDIDLMIITYPHTLWLTRFMFVLILKLTNLRRKPGISVHSSAQVSDKICDNLWLDTSHLHQSTHSLYIAHEVLQAKPILDKNNIHYQLLIQNNWVSGYLPIAYRSSLRNQKNSKIHQPFSLLKLLFPVNFLLWVLQLAYMSKRKTSESIGYGYAYFHPRSSKDI